MSSSVLAEKGVQGIKLLLQYLQGAAGENACMPTASGLQQAGSHEIAVARVRGETGKGKGRNGESRTENVWAVMGKTSGL